MENGKLKKFFDLRLEWENGTDAKSRAEAACRLCRDGAVKPEGQPTPNREQRLLADYAEVRRRKSLRSRIKTENFF